MAEHRIQTKKAAIAQYWLDTDEGLARLPRNEAANWDLPACFACGFSGTDDDDAVAEWKLWNRAVLERCHLVPAALGGSDEPSNLVLLCRRCHQDAPNVADPTYMLDWIARRDPWLSHHLALLNRTVDRSHLRDVVDGFTDEQVEAAQRILSELLRTWTGTHGLRFTESTLEAVIVESITRAGRVAS
ncbi:MAG: hypothetical protein JWQ18_1819 [Conexibacter sp.]|nr:hypothetical protein [Conexibacter sp.]